MEKGVIQLGSSLAVIIPRPMAQQISLHKGDRVRWVVSGQSLRLVPSPQLRPVHLRGVLQGQKTSWKDFRAGRLQLQKSFSKKWKNI